MSMKNPETILTAATRNIFLSNKKKADLAALQKE